MTVEPATTERGALVTESGSGQGAAGRTRSRTSIIPTKPDFERLYAAHARQLLAFLVYRTGDRMLAEDLLSDTFERVLKAKRRFDPGRGSEKTWLYTIALNCLRDQARRASAETRALERSRTPDDDLHGAGPHDQLADHDLVRRGLARLSNDERLAVSLRYGADLTMPEIAKLVNQPLTTVEGRIYRALGKLRESLGTD
jgi:RNA polymerase sigma-70 factor, ECF subfamily